MTIDGIQPTNDQKCEQQECVPMTRCRTIELIMYTHCDAHIHVHLVQWAAVMHSSALRTSCNLYSLIVAHIENEKIFAESLEKLGNYSKMYEGDVPEIGEAVASNVSIRAPINYEGKCQCTTTSYANSKQ